MPFKGTKITISEASKQSGMSFHEILELCRSKQIFTVTEFIDGRVVYFVSPAIVCVLRKMHREKLDRMSKIKLKIQKGGGGRVFKEC